MDEVRLWCLRHAESLDNAAGVLSNCVPGRGLSDRGRAQAAAAAEALRGEPVAAVYTSPARRARETAGAFGRPARVRDGLMECAVGECEGRSDREALDQCREMVRSWVHGDLAARLPGGESGHEMVERFAAAMAGIAAAHPGETAVVVSHVAALSVGLMALCPGLTPDQVWGRPLAHASPFLVRHDGAGWSVTLFAAPR